MKVDRRKLIVGAAASLIIPKVVRAMPFLPPSMRPKVDLANPLAYGLTGVYLPGTGAGKIYDLLGKGANLVCGTSQAYKSTAEGEALDTSAQGGGQGCNGIATAVQQPAKQASLFWRGVLLGTPATNEYVFGVEFQDGNTSPFDAYDLTYLSTGPLQGSVGCGSPVATFSIPWTAPTNVVIDAAVSVDVAVAGFLNLYGNGAFIGQSGIVTTQTIDYGTNPQMQIGSTTNVSQNAANARHLVGYTWNRALTATEVMSLHIDPYQLLIFPEDLITFSRGRH